MLSYGSVYDEDKFTKYIAEGSHPKTHKLGFHNADKYFMIHGRELEKYATQALMMLTTELEIDRETS